LSKVKTKPAPREATPPPVLDEETVEAAAPVETAARQPKKMPGVLSNGTVGVRLSRSFPTQRISFDAQEKHATAGLFDADDSAVSASTKILDVKHPLIKAVRKVIHRIESAHIAWGLPYPEPGIRLIRADRVAAFEETLAPLFVDLENANDALRESHQQILESSREKCGSLFREERFPVDLTHLAATDYPDLNVPEYLKELNPAKYEKERESAEARMQESVRLFEGEMLKGFHALTASLRDRLTGVESGARLLRQLKKAGIPVERIDGEGKESTIVFADDATPKQQAEGQTMLESFDWRPKQVRQDSVDKIFETFQRFRELNLSGDSHLTSMFDKAEQLLRGRVGAEGTTADITKHLNDNAKGRESVRSEMEKLQESIESMLENRPRRRIIRGGVVFE